MLFTVIKIVISLVRYISSQSILIQIARCLLPWSLAIPAVSDVLAVGEIVVGDWWHSNGWRRFSGRDGSSEDEVVRY